MDALIADLTAMLRLSRPETKLFFGWIIFLAINLTAFAMFGIDKSRSLNGQWRIREASLIKVAYLGGWIGAYAGRSYFRHKTKKQPFGKRLAAASLANVIVCFGLTIFLSIR